MENRRNKGNIDVILLRHAESVGNREKIIQGHLDLEPIDPTVPDNLVDAVVAVGTPSAVLTTDLKRGALPAYDLYQKLSAKVPYRLQWLPWNCLRERSFGEWEGQSYSTLGFDAVENVGDYLYRTEQPPNGESLALAQERADFIAYMYLTQFSGHAVVVMTHMCFMNYLLDAFEGRTDVGEYRVVPNLRGFHVKIDTAGKLLQMKEFPEAENDRTQQEKFEAISR